MPVLPTQAIGNTPYWQYSTRKWQYSILAIQHTQAAIQHIGNTAYSNAANGNAANGTAANGNAANGTADGHIADGNIATGITAYSKRRYTIQQMAIQHTANGDTAYCCEETQSLQGQAAISGTRTRGGAAILSLLLVLSAYPHSHGHKRRDTQEPHAVSMLSEV